MNIRIVLLFWLTILLVSPARAAIVYSSWYSDTSSLVEAVGNYQLTVEHDEDANKFHYEFTIDPWNAEVLGVFIDLGNFAVDSNAIGLSSSVGNVTLFASDTASSNCGPGCNLNGGGNGNSDNALLEWNEGDGEWELVFRLQEQGYQGIQTFIWETSDFGVDLEQFFIAGVRSQQLCFGDNLLPDSENSCGGSEKAYSMYPVSPDPQSGTIPEPSSIFMLGAGLFGLGLVRRRKYS